jgi:hypothetical protein
VAGLEAVARCWVKSARGTVLFIGGNTSTHREREDELNQIEINQKGGKSPAQGARARVNPAGSCLTRMPSRVGTGTKARRTG